jgi:hypothetical protein
MATHRSGHRPAGGLHSKQTVHRPLSKPEPKPHSINPEATAQIGISTFLGREALRDGKGYATPIGPSDNVAAVGVGGGRTVMKSGSQGTHGSVDRGVPSGMPSTKGQWPD